MSDEITARDWLYRTSWYAIVKIDVTERYDVTKRHGIVNTICRTSVARQDSSPDIAHFVSGKFQVRDSDFEGWGRWVGWVRGVGGEGALCKIFIKPKDESNRW